MTGILTLLLACTGAKIAPPVVEADDSHPTNGDSSAPDDSTGPVDTAWPIDPGEDLAVVREGNLEVHWNERLEIEGAVGLTWSLPGEGTVALCDLDGDGLDDVWLASPDGSNIAITVYRNTGAGFTNTPALSTTAKQDPTAYYFGCGEFSGDGRADVMLWRTDRTRFLLYANSDGAFDFENASGKADTSLDADMQWVVGDFTGDGVDEIAVRESSKLTVVPVTDLNPQMNSPLYTYETQADYKLAALDVNRDGLDDLAQYNGSALVVVPGTGTSFDGASSTIYTITGDGTPLGGNLR